MTGRAILVTGFEPYGGRSLNPACEAMRALDGHSIGGAHVIGRPLPVSLARLPGEIEALLAEYDPDAVISLGLWPGESAIRIERVGINIADFEIPDNEGAVAVDEMLAGDGATARLATLPLRAIEQAMLAAGIPARLSSTAGTFLCNACLYNFLDAIARRARPALCGFLHVPYVPEQVAGLIVAARRDRRIELHQRGDLASMSLDVIVKAVEIAVAETAAVLS